MADFTISDVLAWARTKPADERYSFSCTTACALCQFLRETGRALKPLVTGSDWEDRASRRGRRDIPKALQGPLISDTFGELVGKLEKLCPGTRSDWETIDVYLTDIEQVSA